MTNRLHLNGVAACVAVVVLCGALPLSAKNNKVRFIQQDKVVAFDPVTGIGAQTGTVTGDITGVSIVNFQFTISSFPNFVFNNRAGITNLDGDQIIFKNVGTGRFNIPALADPTLGPATPPFQVFANGLGGPLRGTYEVVAVSGAFSVDFHLGDVFQYRAVAYNPSTPPTAPGSLGSVYVEVSER